jgi:hypothetical protein
MPYDQPPAILRQQIATLIRHQLRDIPQLPATEFAAFRGKGGGRFLWQMLEFVLPDERDALARQLQILFPLT